MSKKALNVQDDSRRKGIQGNTSKSEMKCVCLNARSIINKKTELNIMVDDIKPHIIGITESWANNDITNAEMGLEGYVMFRKDRIGRRGGGVLLYIKDTIPAYEVQLQEEADCNDAIWCNLVTGHTTVIIGVVYRCPNITKENNETIHNAINEVSKGDCIIMGDFNHGNIKWDTLQSTGVEDSTFLCLVQDNFLTQHVLEPTRAARVLVLSSQKELVDNVVIQEPLGSSDHNQLHFNIKIKSDKTKVKQCRRDFRKGNYKDIRKRLAHIDWNDKMKNKTATECWNILRGGLDSAIDSFVPMKKQGKRSKKKHLSKEAFRKIRHKQNMWRVYKHTGKDQDYVVYKEALNAATNEVRKSKRNFELKLAQNIKSDSKSFYAYVRSKQNVRDKVGPLEDNAGDKITEGILMAEELNMHFSSVFTREDTSSLPVPETKFNGSEEERLGQLIVTPEVVASKMHKCKVEEYLCEICQRSYSTQTKLARHKRETSCRHSLPPEAKRQKPMPPIEDLEAPPPALEDEYGSELQDVIIQHWGSIRTHTSHGPVQSRYNIRLMTSDIGGLELGHIFAAQTTAFKVNIYYGFILRNRTSGPYRYYHSSCNCCGRYLDEPSLITTLSRISWNE